MGEKVDGQIPVVVENLCQMYGKLIIKELPGTICGVYLYGSVVLADFHVGSSDIDFVTVVNRKLSEADLVKLEKIHGEVRKLFPQTPMNGIYVQVHELGLLEQAREPIPYYFDGTMYRAGYFELNPVTWFELKHHGVAVFGPAIGALGLEIEPAGVRAYMAENLNSYWRNWVEKRRKGISRHSLGLVFCKEQVEWGVLGVTRQYYTLRENGVVSKSEAGEYALTEIPERWQRIIEEALRIRKGIPKSNYTSVIERRNDTIRYMDFIIEEGNKMLR